MEIVFKSTWPDPGTVPAGEICIRPASTSDAGRRDLAAYVVSRGVKALLQGGDVPQRIIVSCDTTRPTLDDMLAAAFVQRLVEGKPLGGSAAAFAKYAALVREGLQPGDMPLENSIEGIFLAIRANAGNDLSQSAVAVRFLADWDRLAEIILRAVDAGKDPFTSNLMADASEFARERAFLKKDQDVYREDVQRGQQWIVQVPGGPPQSSLLVLEKPRSLLFKYWSRRDTSAPIGGSYILLAVHWDAGNWAVSTDPVQRLPIRELAEALQAIELTKNPAAKNDPWFDGAPFGYTLVASPRAGSKLKDEEIFIALKKWAKAKPVVDVTKKVGRRIVSVSGGVLLTLVITFCTTILNQHLNRPAPAPTPVASATKDVDFRTRGSVLSTTQVQDLRSQGIHIPGYAVIVGVGGQQGEFPGLPASCRNARLFYALLRDKFGYDPKNMRLLTDQPKDPNDAEDPDIAADGTPTKEGVQKAVNEIGAMTGRYAEGNRTNFVFFYGGHGDPRQAAGNNKIGYLVLSGYTRTDADDTGFDMGYLVKFISQRVASSHQMMLVDCCYSGFVIKGRGLDEGNKSAIYELWKEKARAVITAGTADQQSLEVGPKALFTSNLIRALTPTDSGHMPADENGDGVVTDQELADYLAKVVSTEAASLPGNHQLTPQYLRALPESDDDVGQFLFIPKSDAK